MARLLRLVLTPDGTPPCEGWSFRIQGTIQGGWFVGNLPNAARSAWVMARRRRCAAVLITIPHAGWCGLFAKSFLVVYPGDAAQLRDLDVALLRSRAARETRWRQAWERWQVGFRFPRVWPVGV